MAATSPKSPSPKPARARPAPVRADAATIETVRRFSRFYTRQLGLLDRGLLDTEFSLPESRIIWELAHRYTATATQLGADLGMDAGYLSRLLRGLRDKDLVLAQPNPQDARQHLLQLSASGKQAFKRLDQGSRRQVAAWLAGLEPEQCQTLAAALLRAEALLASDKPPRSYQLREHRIGDIGWVIRRQGMLYAQEYGWDGSFEALVAEIAARFIQQFKPEWERVWIAEMDGEIVGSVFLVRKSARVAQLRLLYVEPKARGLGIGARLTDECIAWARGKGYKTLTLWTNDMLVSARRIYVAAGFKLMKEERHHSFGHDMVGQHWDLAL